MGDVETTEPAHGQSEMAPGILGVVILGTMGQMIVIQLLGYAFDPALFLTRLMMLLTLLILGPLSEELGWRGYALDRLQTCWNALTSSLILGVIWSMWHLPLFYIIGTSQYLYDISFLGFMLGTTTISVLYSWAYNNTGGSIWSAVFFHWIYTYALDTLGMGMTTPASGLSVAAICALHPHHGCCSHHLGAEYFAAKVTGQSKIIMQSTWKLAPGKK